MRWNVMCSLHYVIFSLLVMTPQPALALQWTAEKSQAIDRVFAEYDRTSGPGCAVGVAEAGRLVFARGYGIGQMDHRIPLSGESVFYLASVSKQFAAAAIVIAEHEGHLSLDDLVSAHIPEFPAYAEGAVTIRHLVHHTSGVRDYLTLMRLAGTPYENILSDEEMLGLITRQRELNFVPGTEHLYSNSGYVLMAEIVKRATGRSLREYADEKIFRPLDMSNTHFHDDRLQVVPGRVFSYDPPAAGDGRADADGSGRTGGSWRTGGGWRTSYLIDFDKVGDGGLYSSVADLAKWDRAFYEDVLGVPGFAERMYHRGVLAGGDTIAYARGLSVGERRGLPRVSHGGGFMAFRTMIARYPETANDGDHPLQRRHRPAGGAQHCRRRHRPGRRVHGAAGRTRRATVSRGRPRCRRRAGLRRIRSGGPGARRHVPLTGTGRYLAPGGRRHQTPASSPARRHRNAHRPPRRRLRLRRHRVRLRA